MALIFPNYLLHEEFGEPSDPPLGITHIAAVLEGKGHDVGIIDAAVDNLTMDGVCSRLTEIKPDIVGISCNYSPLHNPTLEYAKMVKSEFGIPVIVGGNHATAMAENILRQSKDIDVVVRGEGEETMPNLIGAVHHGVHLGNIEGITYRSGDAITSTPDAPLVVNLDGLPMPAYHLVPMGRYRRYNLLSNRGCPFQCSFCSSHVIFRQRVRHRSPKKVMDEVEYLLKNYGEKPVWFSSDTFIVNPKQTTALMGEMIKRKLGMKWSCLMRVDIAPKELLERMKEAGCVYISYGVESGNQEMLDRMGKGITVEEVLATLKLTHEVGIRQYAFFLVGYIGETWQTIYDSYKLIYQSQLDGAAFSIPIPLPGSRMMKELLEAKLITLEDMDWDRFFARTLHETHPPYAAELASRWTGLSSAELIEACEIGHRLPEIFRHVSNKHGVN